MKRVALVLSLALAAIPAVASAQIGFGAAAGASFPMGDYGKGLSSGYHAQASLDLSIPLAPIGFRFDGSLDHFDLSGSTVSGSSRIIGGEANVLLGFGAVPLLGPYLIAGVGAYNVNSEFGTASSSATKLGGSVGAGIRFGLAGFGVFAETGYHYIQSPATGANAPSYVPVMFGISF
jgi:Outer membrane protein beta-barrel domain